jgi:hypothetical protein
MLKWAYSKYDIELQDQKAYPSGNSQNVDSGEDGGLNQEVMEEMLGDQDLGQQWSMAKKKKRSVFKKSKVQNNQPTK